MAESTKQWESGKATGSAANNGVLLFTTRILPWLLGVAMLGVFLITLNHGIALDGIGLADDLEGNSWTPQISAPVTYLVTRPLSWLPGAWIPVAMNLLTAGLAALSLGFLARAVALLPHDIAKDPPPERRGFAPPRLLASGMAWLPPLFAVLVCGLQLNFWQNAITATSQMVNLLMFAYIIRCFLEFNASGRDSWLLRAAAVHGLAVANDWIMVLFIPVFLVGLVWVKRLYSLNQRKLEQMLEGRGSLKLELLWQIPSCWLAGFSLIALMPLAAALSTNGHMGFWGALTHVFQVSYSSVVHVPRQFLITSCLICVMPVFLIGLRYYHFLEAASEVNLFLGTTAFQLIYGFFLLVNIWTMFDTPLSPRRQAPMLDTLPFYFLEALSIGFFMGHFLLTANANGVDSEGERRRSSSSGRQRKQLLLLWAQTTKWSAVAGVMVLFLAVPIALVYKNLPAINLIRHSPTGDYFNEVTRALPPAGAVIIGKDPAQLAFLQAKLNQNGSQGRYLLLNIAALAESTNYWDFLKRQKHAGFDAELEIPSALPAEMRKFLPVTLLQGLATNHAIYCLPPAPIDNYIAELFYFEPEGLLERAIRYPGDEAFAPPISPALTQENETFWRNFRARSYTNLVHRLNPPPRLPASSTVKRFVNTLRFWPEPDPESVIAGRFYAVALNDWGVELQHRDELAAAGKCFADALLLNAHNSAAQINEDFNTDFQAHRETTIQTPLDTIRSMNKYRDWRLVVEEGAVDEPNFCFMRGAILAENRLLRPAIAQLERAKQLSPANLDISTTLARLFVECHDVTNSLAAANDILALSPTNVTGLFIKSNSEIRMEDYKDAIPLLNQILAAEPTNTLALLNRAVAYRSSYLFTSARRDYNAVIATQPEAFPAYYDLAQMDDDEYNVRGAITNYELFLKYSPTNVAEIPAAQARLKVLQTPTLPTDNSSGPVR